MKIFRLVYEEIDTDDKWNEKENIKMKSQQTLSPYELSMYDEKYQAMLKIETKRRVWEELMEKVFTQYQ